MTTIQKFKRGNLVRVLAGHQIFSYSNGKGKVRDIASNEIGELAIIDYSYAEKYGGGNTKEYSVTFLENGNSTAWKHEDQLLFVDEGGEHLFEQAKANKEKLIKQETDLKYILENWSNIISKNPNSIMIQYLFGKIGFKSSFERNGEFFALYHDWHNMLPLFHIIINAKSEDEILLVLNPEINPDLKYKIISFYYEIKQLSGN